MAMGSLLIRNHCQFVRPYKDVLVLQLSIRDCTLAIPKSVDLFCFFFSKKMFPIVHYLLSKAKNDRKDRDKVQGEKQRLSTRKNIVGTEYLSLELILT